MLFQFLGVVSCTYKPISQFSINFSDFCSHQPLIVQTVGKVWFIRAHTLNFSDFL